MPQCPHCQTPYEQGARYCSVCGSFLLHPEEGDTFCPQCGIRVSPKQEYCHECDAPLKKPAEAAKAPEPAPAPKPPPAAPAPAPPAGAPAMQPWVIGLLAAAGAIIIILIVLLFLRGAPPPAPTPGVAPKAEAPAAPAPATPAPEPGEALKMELLGVLSTLREANLKKNIDLYMSVYSPLFPNLDEKRKNMLKIWDIYDYTSLAFTLDEIKPVDAANVNAKATWYIDAKNRSTGETTSVKQVYQVNFIKEQGKWRIRSLEEVEDKEEEE